MDMGLVDIPCGRLALDDPPPRNYSELADIAWSRAVQIAKEDGGHPPTAVFQTHECYHMMNLGNLYGMPDAALGKQLAANVIHKYASDVDAHALAIINEAWMLDVRNEDGKAADEARERYDKEGLEHAPGRKEILLVHAQGRTGECYRMGEIVRDQFGKVVEVAPIELPPGMTTRGRFDGVITQGEA
jgi:hypothetical protein